MNHLQARPRIINSRMLFPTYYRILTCIVVPHSKRITLTPEGLCQIQSGLQQEAEYSHTSASARGGWRTSGRLALVCNIPLLPPVRSQASCAVSVNVAVALSNPLAFQINRWAVTTISKLIGRDPSHQIESFPEGHCIPASKASALPPFQGAIPVYR